MPRKESTYPVDWMRIAEKDLARVGRLLDNHDPEMGGFYFVERYPFVIDSGLTENDVRESLEQVGELIARIRVEVAGE